ncbi:hypothetical protein LshimejAT787_0112180 [Lyophyllum shimeji]|uniref:Uncharacterized protein n=1 Tax=Lyophyllum shimeji TaxID=47721 RepID=A0A9P3PF55_LYOSH|nr:hypothetical protein LshimejAT787_0112180 [Lyophyllum shimeji]
MTRTMTLAHRAEVLDDHMNDSNWKKLLDMPGVLCRKFQKAEVMSAKAAAYFASLCSSIKEEHRATWEEEIAYAESRRLVDITAMDIMHARAAEPAPSASAVVEDVHTVQQDEWIQQGLRLEAKQIEIQDKVRRLAKYPREDDQKAIETDRAALRSRLDVFVVLASKLGLAASVTHFVDDETPTNAFDDIDIEGAADPPPPTQATASLSSAEVPAPELIVLGLPSAMHQCSQSSRAAELRLRQSHADALLQNLRELIAEKSFHYSHIMRVAPRKAVRTRARTTLGRLNHQIGTLCRVYSKCRASLVRLGADERTLQRYQQLTAVDIKSSTAILEPNRPGSTTDHVLSWIWQLDGPVTDTTEGLTEFQRIHFLRGRATKQRWAEEFTLVGYEMQWTAQYFIRQAKIWQQRGLQSAEDANAGAAAYARRKSAMWMAMAFETQNRHPKLPEWMVACLIGEVNFALARVGVAFAHGFSPVVPPLIGALSRSLAFKAVHIEFSWLEALLNSGPADPGALVPVYHFDWWNEMDKTNTLVPFPRRYVEHALAEHRRQKALSHLVNPPPLPVAIYTFTHLFIPPEQADVEDKEGLMEDVDSEMILAGSVPAEDEEEVAFPVNDWGDLPEDAQSSSITVMVSGNPATTVPAVALDPKFPSDDAGDASEDETLFPVNDLGDVDEDPEMVLSGGFGDGDDEDVVFLANDWGDQTEDTNFGNIKDSLPEEDDGDVVFPANDWGDQAEGTDFGNVKGSLPEEDEEDVVFPANDQGDHPEDAESSGIKAIVAGNPETPLPPAVSDAEDASAGDVDEVLFPVNDLGDVDEDEDIVLTLRDAEDLAFPANDLGDQADVANPGTLPIDTSGNGTTAVCSNGAPFTLAQALDIVMGIEEPGYVSDLQDPSSEEEDDQSGKEHADESVSEEEGDYDTDSSRSH